MNGGASHDVIEGMTLGKGMEQTAIVAERGGSAIAMTGGLMGTLTEYHDAIATLCTMGGLVVAIAGFIVHWWYLHRGNRKKFGRRHEDR